MQGPHSDEALRGLDGYEQMVDTFQNAKTDGYEQMVDTFQNAKTYWRLWGPLGEPMVRVVEAWVEQQRAYVQWLRENYEAEKRP